MSNLLTAFTSPWPRPVRVSQQTKSLHVRRHDSPDAVLLAQLRAALTEYITRTVLHLSAVAQYESGNASGLPAFGTGYAAFRARLGGMAATARHRAVLHPAFAATLQADLRASTGGTQAMSRWTGLGPPGYLGELWGVDLWESALCPQVGPDEYASMIVGEGGIGLEIDSWVTTERADSIALDVTFAAWIHNEQWVHVIRHGGAR